MSYNWGLIVAVVMAEIGYKSIIILLAFTVKTQYIAWAFDLEWKQDSSMNAHGFKIFD